jgi:hypothetical protein
MVEVESEAQTCADCSGEAEADAVVDQAACAIGGAWVRARLSGQHKASSQPVTEPIAISTGRRAAELTLSKLSRLRSSNGQGHEQATDWTPARQHRRAQCQHKKHADRGQPVQSQNGPQAKAESDA